jgi:hypothetical protein
MIFQVEGWLGGMNRTIEIPPLFPSMPKRQRNAQIAAQIEAVLSDRSGCANIRASGPAMKISLTKLIAPYAREASVAGIPTVSCRTRNEKCASGNCRNCIHRLLRSR